MKRKLLALMLSVAIMSTLAGCGKAKEAAVSADAGTAEEAVAEDTAVKDTAATGKKITVLLPNHEMDTVGFYESQTREFEKETGIEVELINMGWDNVADKVTVEMTSGGSSYDVIEFDNSWVAKYAQNGWLEELDGYITDDMKNGIVPGLLDKFTSNGHLYGIVWNNDTRFYMYNKAKLEEAGFDHAPATWDELNEQTMVLKENKLVDYGYIDSYMQAQSGCNEFVQLVYSFGGEFFDQDGKPIVATDPGVRAAYEYLVAAYADGIVDPSALTADYETTANVFCSGATAYFMQAWPGVYQTANDESVSTIVNQIAVADYTISGDGKSQAVLTLPEAMAIPKTSKNKDEAWQYIQYMSSKEFDKLKAETIGALPVYTELFADADLLALYPYWESFGKQSEYSRGLPDLLWFDEFSSILQVETQNIILGTISVEEGLEQMQTQLEEIAAKY